MSKIKLKAIVPIYGVFTSKKYYENYYSCLKSYILNIQSLLQHLNNRITFSRAKLVEPTWDIEVMFNIMNIESAGLSHGYNFLEIETEFSIDKKEVKKMNPESNFKDIDLVSIVALELSLAIEDSLILTSIAFPGQLQTAKGRVFYNNDAFNIIDSVTGYNSELIYNHYFENWPSLNFIDLEKVIKWEKQLGLFSVGYSSNPVQKAFASYTQVLKFSSIDNFEILFWAMQGLEGFYCNGKGELRSQLKEKSKLFLGDWKDRKNIVGHLYDLRSKFVHGDFPVERWRNEYYSGHSFEKEYDKLVDGTQFALQILIATIQKCIEENIIDIEFQYKIIKKAYPANQSTLEGKLDYEKKKSSLK